MASSRSRKAAEPRPEPRPGAPRWDARLSTARPRMSGPKGGDFHPRIATYFTLYPEPIGLPSQGTHIILFEGELRGYSDLKELVVHYENEKPYSSLNPASMTMPFVSIRFHRGHREFSLVTQNMQDVFRVVREVAPALGQEAEKEQPPSEDDPFALYTVVEMVTPLIMPHGAAWVPAPPTQDYMGPNLTRCIEGLRQVVTAYRLTENILIPAPARERLGPTVVGSMRPADPSHGTWDDSGSVVINAFAVGGHPGMPEAPGADSSKKIATFIQQRIIDHPVSAMMELQADARVALQIYGDFRSAVMLAYTASEVLLDGVLLAMFWEEGIAIDQAAEAFAAPLVNRAKNQFHTRLGGNWSGKATSPVGKWRTGLVLLRHHIAHTGLLPDREDADQALAAYEDLRRHVLDRLAASMRRYPNTVALFLSEAGLKRRGAWTKKARQIASGPSETLQNFTAYREAILQARLNR